MNKKTMGVILATVLAVGLLEGFFSQVTDVMGIIFAIITVYAGIVAMLSEPNKVAGIVVLSGWLIALVSFDNNDAVFLLSSAIVYGVSVYIAVKFIKSNY